MAIRRYDAYRFAMARHGLTTLFLLLWVVTACAAGGVIQGVVLEQASGRPMSRTLVHLAGIPDENGKAAPPVTQRTGRGGDFVFTRITPGSYLVFATREGFFPASWGQRVPSGRGRPVEVTQSSLLFVELRMRHKGAVTGRVLDENGVGAAGVPVVAYRARLPLRAVGSAVSGEWGRYRIDSLEQGKYWVRTGGHILEDRSGWLATFGPGGQAPADARVHSVTLDADTAYADISPDPGSVYSLSGSISCGAAGPVAITLSGEAGQRFASASCLPNAGGFRFDGLAPGPYEIFASLDKGKETGFVSFSLGGHLSGVDLRLSPPPQVSVFVEEAGGRGRVNVPVSIIARRVTLAQTDAPVSIPVGTVPLAPGLWEFRARAGSGYYIADIGSRPGRTSSRLRPEAADPDWFPIRVEHDGTSIPVIVASDAASIQGRVMSEGKVVAGAPVFLWARSAAARRSLGGAVETISGSDGRFSFSGLPPGEYQILATFDASEADADLMEISRAIEVRAGPGATTEAELTVWVAPY